MKQLMLLVLSVAVALASNSASAAIEVVASGAILSTYQITSDAQGSVILINAAGNPGGNVIVQANAPNERIQSITLVTQTNPPFSAAQLSVGLIIRQKPGTNGTFSYLGSIARNGENDDLIIGPVDIVGPIGDPSSPPSNAIIGQVINRITASGDIAATIQASGSAQFPGNITTVESTGGRILGDISCTGRIASGITASGTIGSTTRTAVVACSQDATLIQGSAIYANVFVGQLTRLATTSGPFQGSLQASSIQGSAAGTFGLSIAGNMDADVTISGDVKRPMVVTGYLLGGRTLKIGGGLVYSGADDGSLRLTTGGLQGQVVINSAAGSGAWDGFVRVGATFLSPVPYYSQASAGLGGGAVGLVPFHLYESDCVPPHALGITVASRNQATLLETDFSSDIATPVTIRSYGPMKRNTGTLAWVNYVQLYAITESPYQPIMELSGGFNIRGPGDQYTVNGQTVTVPARVFRISRATGVCPKPGLYAFVPFKTNKSVVCDLGTGASSPLGWLPFDSFDLDGDGIAEPAYVFRIAPDCDGNHVNDFQQITDGLAQTPQVVLDANNNGTIDSCESPSNPCRVDINHDHMVSVQDIFDFLSCWFPNGAAADFNLNGRIEVQDIFDYLAAWFAFPSGTQC